MIDPRIIDDMMDAIRYMNRGFIGQSVQRSATTDKDILTMDEWFNTFRGDDSTSIPAFGLTDLKDLSDLSPKEPHKCACEISVLMGKGCQCGGK